MVWDGGKRTVVDPEDKSQVAGFQFMRKYAPNLYKAMIKKYPQMQEVVEPKKKREKQVDEKSDDSG